MVSQKSVPEPSSSGAAYYSEVSIYPKVATVSVYLSIEFTQKAIHIIYQFKYTYILVYLKIFLRNFYKYNLECT